MTVDIKVPTLGESVTEAIVAKWFKAAGDQVAADEPLVELETDKVTLEVPAPASGKLLRIAADSGATVEVDSILGAIAEGDGGAIAAQKPVPSAPAAGAKTPAATTQRTPQEQAATEMLSPAVRRLVAENALDAAAIPASGQGGRLLKSDVLTFVEKAAAGGNGKAPSLAPAPAPALSAAPAMQAAAPVAEPGPAGPREERVKMTRLRQRIAERLKEAQSTAAILTTFNEADMTEVMALRERYRDSYEKRHGVRLGFMSFFVKAAIAALRDIPEVNAEIQDDEIVYKNHCDIGVAVGTAAGLVVPVVRDADRLSFADVEKTISALARKARDGKLSIEEMQGGTFTITNGGVYGSLLSTPILNLPQSGILGMHKIEKRPVAVVDEVKVRPMMYLALSYDHRIVDGREAVTFLVRVRDCIENPERLLLDV